MLTSFLLVRRQVVPIALSAAAILLALTTLLALAPPSLRDGAVASFGIFTALATGAAAVAAWRSASSSSAAARDVREALGLAMKPSLEITPFHGDQHSGEVVAMGVLGIEIKNSSTWPAVDIECEARLHDGRTYRGRLGRLESTKINAPTTTAFVELARNVEAPSWRQETAPAGKYTLENLYLIRYWDERRLLQWEYSLRMIFSYEISENGRLSASQGLIAEQMLPSQRP